MLDVEIINRRKNKSLIKMRNCPEKYCEQVIAEVYCNNCNEAQNVNIYGEKLGVYRCYPGVNLITNNNEIRDKIKNEANNYYKNECHKHKKRIDEYLDEYGVIDADIMIKDWFPKRDIDLFISHSHKDIGVAFEFKRNLEKIGINAFVDYFVWDSAYDLLKAVDDKYSLKNGAGIYCYDRRNKTTSNIFTILLMELFKKMNKARGIIFINTDNSIMKQYSRKCNYTESPWIYAELLQSSIIMNRYNSFFASVSENLNLEFKIKHNVKIDHLVKKNYEDINMYMEKLINKVSSKCNKKEKFFDYVISRFIKDFSE